MTKDSSEKKKTKKKNKLPSFLSLGLILTSLFFLLNLLWPRNQIDQVKLKTARWPLSVKNHLQMAQIYFDNGDEDRAIKEYQQAEKLYQYFSLTGLNKNLKPQLEETKKMVYLPQELENQIKSWETVSKSKPYFRNLLLRLTVLNYQAYEDEKAQAYWQQAFYLDPNNKLVQEIGEILNQ